MVATAAYAPVAPPNESLVAQPPRDHVDTEYAARLDRSTGAINITAPPSGIMAVGVKSVTALLQPLVRGLVGFLFHVLEL